MGSEWITYSISEVGTIITGNTPPARVKNSYSVNNGIPFVTPKDMDGRRLIEQTERYLTSDGIAAVKRNIVPAMSVAVSCIGSDMGKTILLQKESVTNQQINTIVIDEVNFNPKYIYYVLSTKKQYLKDIAGGSATPILNKSDFGKITIKAPAKCYQDFIVKYLDCLDSKLELNRKINQTLEQMAQTLFKSWFVDFDPVIDNALDTGFFEQDLAFSEELLCRVEVRKAVRESDNFKPLSEDIRQLFPDAFEECTEPALGLGGWVPKGWCSSPVGSLIELIGGGTPKTSESSYWGGDIPWFSVVDAPNDSDVFVMDTEKKITELGIQNSSAKILKVGTTIISARGTVGKCALVAKPMAINQSCYGIVGKNGIHDYFTYYLIRHSVSHLQQRSHGSVFSTITRDTFSSFNFIFSGHLIANAFGETISFWFEKIDRNNQQNYILQKLRDTLLPKLISGELSLNDVKIDIPEEILI